jgi:hypothetical protein
VHAVNLVKAALRSRGPLSNGGGGDGDEEMMNTLELCIHKQMPACGNAL